MTHFEFDEPQFLEPPHSHDPTHVSHIAAIPSDVLEKLPRDARASLLAIQESTSVAFASHTRLQELLRERFTRLVPAKNQDHNADMIVKCGSCARSLHPIRPLQYSEPAFFNYQSHLRVEKEYLLEEAYPDYKHKAIRVDFGGYHNLSLKIDGKETTLIKWWEDLQNAVEKWMEDAEEVEIFHFEDTVAEYKAFQAKEIRKMDARNERNRRRKTMLDLERPDFNTLQKLDSGVGL